MNARRPLPTLGAALLVLPGCGASSVDPLAAERSVVPLLPACRARSRPAGRRAGPPARRRPAHRDRHRARRLHPDLPTGELVFRLVPNGPGPAAAGSRLTVDAAGGDDVAGSGYEDAGADGPGGLFVVRLDARLAPGEAIEVVLDFSLTLGRGDRDEPRSRHDRPGLGPGGAHRADDRRPGRALDPPGRPAHVDVGRAVARDVSVAVGRFDTASGTGDGGVEVTTGVLPGAAVPAPEFTAWTLAAIDQLEARFGPFPYATLTVSLLPVDGGGIEYSSSILLAGADRLVLLHEVAHTWFYGMVGDSQFRDPWLDEAFATYAESVASPVSDGAAAYVRQLYGYPDDVARALADLPAALDVLTAAGALDG